MSLSMIKHCFMIKKNSYINLFTFDTFYNTNIVIDKKFMYDKMDSFIDKYPDSSFLFSGSYYKDADRKIFSYNISYMDDYYAMYNCEDLTEIDFYVPIPNEMIEYIMGSSEGEKWALLNKDILNRIDRDNNFSYTHISKFINIVIRNILGGGCAYRTVE